ncbi:tyrosine-protein kinase STYK1 [Triplophysa rosa]|uniref:Tyrosine-protein kinase STYK1-like n=1 Tax=Triplophysa rosa TaxID=992332 RepID=A0A9W7TKS0_TRIRA|nr:tyrosine-protein kinase STYK1 [Triplophysa rosa]KAI7799025.1 putative tyrosine-protein kinase STYK1-like [Triplophysa rosa]
MSNSSNLTYPCIPGNTLCEVLVFEVELIVVPVLFLAAFLAVLIVLLVLKFSHKPSQSYRPQKFEKHDTNHHNNTNRHRNSTRQHLQGIDAPPEFNPMEHEIIPMTAQSHKDMQNCTSAVPETSTERRRDIFQLITPLPLAFSVKHHKPFTLYRAVMDRQPVILRVLKESDDANDRQFFLDFACFLTELGPHPSLPRLLGQVTAEMPQMIVLEELEHKDLLSFLWRCRQDHPGQAAPCDLTERRIFTMGAQIGSALEYLHSKDYIHGKVRARSILVDRDLSVKLWGLAPAFRMATDEGSPLDGVEEIEIRKWQAPEVLARKPLSQSSDIWSFGILLYEIVTLGEAPFPKVMASELLQYLQRGNKLKKTPNCSKTLYSIIESCCQWRPNERPSLAELVRKLQSAERRANDQTVIRVSEPLDIKKYMEEVGYADSVSYAGL